MARRPGGFLSRQRPFPRVTGPVVVTGAAGFIGAALALRLLETGQRVIGVDHFSAYYDVRLKEARSARLRAHAAYTEVRLDLADRAGCEALFARHRPQRVVHLAAQAGVRHSLTHPHEYVEANVSALINVLEGCRRHAVGHLVFASTSSVYGATTTLPFSEHQAAVHPVSLYAATKRAGELMAHTYAHLFGLPVTALRFFTVYGPWGRPDMALFKFTQALLEDRPIEVYNHGRHRRDFTYVDDIVAGIEGVLARAPAPDPAWDPAHPDPACGPGPFRVYNLGHGRPVELMHYIAVLEECLARKARIEYLPLQAGDVAETAADVSELAAAVGYAPRTPVEVGVRRFVEWYRGYYGV
jgi:UDP-glucuronate 4-epimerase